MKILLAHPGTQHSHLLAQALYKREALLAFCTSLAFGEGSKLAHWLPARLVSRRQLSVPASLVHTQPLLEFVERMVGSGRSARDSFLVRNRYYQRQVPEHLILEADAIIGFDTSSSVLADRARKVGKKFYVELTTPHPIEKLRITRALCDRYPEWSVNMANEDLGDVVEDGEVSRAFHVLAPSEFVKATYVSRGLAAEKVTINPYGVYPEQFPLKEYSRVKKVRFLFMGSMAVNKGLPLLLEAWKKVNTEKAELVVAGYGSLPSSVRLPGGVSMMGRIEKAGRVRLMHSCDVFVCPSFYEGISLAQIESMCCGLPLIGTTASGADGIITEGREGFIVPSGAIGELAEKMNIFVNYPENIETMGMQAHSRAAELSWDAYADRWLSLISAQSNAGG
jgi:glycosyltransferase involved in cell wall biosynthesis